MESSRSCKLLTCTLPMGRLPTAWMCFLLSMLLALTSTPPPSSKGSSFLRNLTLLSSLVFLSSFYFSFLSILVHKHAYFGHYLSILLHKDVYFGNPIYLYTLFGIGAIVSSQLIPKLTSFITLINGMLSEDKVKLSIIITTSTYQRS